MEKEPTFVEAFLDNLRYERALSQATIDGYQGDLEAFESFFKALDNGLTWDNIDRDVAREWVVHLMEKGQKPTSVKRRLSALRSFYKFLLRRGLVQHDPVHNITSPKAERPLPAFIREDDMARLLDSEDTFDSTFEGIRDRLIITMFYETGIRLSELTGLRLCDVNTSAQTIKVRGKGNKERIVPFGEALLHLINIYADAREGQPGADGELLFLSRHGQRMRPQVVRKMIKAKLALVTDQRKRSPHVLRHSFATAMLNHDAHLESVKELLGHEKLSTTEIYTHTSLEELRRVYNDAHPRA